MKNFFYRDTDYDLFKKALRSTKNEPVVINLLSSDSSLVDESGNTAVADSQRKQMSAKFQASPFDKFFGPRKKRTDPLDMKDFSSWRNKNYRESEKQINETPEDETKFSFADYLNGKARNEKYNDEDKLKSENQKSIEQMSSSDEGFKKFSLDSYLNKLEQETKAKKDFAEREDLFDSTSDSYVMAPSSEQDENFMLSSDVGVEDVAFGGVSGEKFAFDREELDTVKARLEKMEREAINGKDKPTSKVLSVDDINEISGKSDDDDFDLDKLGIEDDIERVNEKINSLNKALQITGDDETETPKVEHKRFIQVNKNFEEDENDEEIESIEDSEDIDILESDSETLDEIDELSETKDELDENGESTDVESSEKSGSINIVGGSVTIAGGESGVVKPTKIKGAVASDAELDESEEDGVEGFVDVVEIPEGEFDTDVDGEFDDEESELNTRETKIVSKGHDYLTKADFKDFTEEIVNKFSEMYRGVPAGEIGVGESAGAYQQPYMGAVGQQHQQTGVDAQQAGGNPQIYQQHSELQAKIVELLEQNKKSDEEVAERLKLAEIEKQRIADKYEARLRELETSMKQREEDVKQQVYIERLKNDIKFKKSESKYKLREEHIRESEKLSSESQLASEKLKAELKNYLNVSNLEMDKKLLECVNKLHKDTIDARKESDENDEAGNVTEEEIVEEVKRPARTRARASRPASRRKTSTVKSRMRTRTPRRKIDSDIIGGINFD